ncbi:hypothetical protein AN403_4696 [Pseudomonas fluorescens]|uniref:VOC domain-containing protein n=1 Tax=Pseudomonas fluorescens TaxID=294 RepID=A0A0P8X409_PSEFL|nr:hypothetical protein [Pseudomonas fluorescens]KPU60748.1 hypothetical protein AN403_4696 [Pseudomonas fluorescens]
MTSAFQLIPNSQQRRTHPLLYRQSQDLKTAMIEGAGLHIELITRPGENFKPVDRSPPPTHLSQLGWKALVLHTADLKAVTSVLRLHDVEICWAEQQLSEHLQSTLIRDPEGNLINILGPFVAA